MRRVAPLVIALVAAATFTARFTYDPDLFWHLAQGREVLAGHIVRTNLFSATAPDYPQPYTSWAFEALAGGASSAGLMGVQLLQFALLAAAFLALYASARVRNSRTSALAVLLLSVFVIEPRAMPRPYLLSFIGLSACAWFIERWIASGRRTLHHAPLLIGLVALWANGHSEAVFGVGFVGLVGVSECIRPRAITRETAARVIGVAILCLLATVLTPYGTGMWRYLAENAFVPQALRIAELQAPAVQAYPAFFAYLAVLAVLLASRPGRLPLWEAAVAIVFAALGLRYIRFMPMVVFATAPIVAARLDALIAKGWDRRAVLATVIAVMVVTAPASPARMWQAWRIGSDSFVPPDVLSADAVAFARAHHLSGPLFNSMNLGGYLEWTMPEARVFQDSRLQAYPTEHFRAILDASQSPEAWRALVAPVDWAMVSLARPNELSGAGKFASEEWAPVFRDRAVEILVRRTGRYAAIPALPALTSR